MGTHLFGSPCTLTSYSKLQAPLLKCFQALLFRCFWKSKKLRHFLSYKWLILQIVLNLLFFCRGTVSSLHKMYFYVNLSSEEANCLINLACSSGLALFWPFLMERLALFTLYSAILLAVFVLFLLMVWPFF